MKVLVLAPDYPKPGRQFGGVFNERCVTALKGLCDDIQVLIPRPYAPPVLSSLVPRWGIYASTPFFEIKNGVPVYRPVVPVIPRVASAFWIDSCAFYFCRQLASEMHRRVKFDAIISFDLLGTGGLSWRLAREFGIPASGWATGGDVRVSGSSSLGRVLLRAIKHLDLVFYQSQELLANVTNLMERIKGNLNRERHFVLPRGIPEPPVLPKALIRERIRHELGIARDQLIVLSVGRVSRDKGIYELIEAA